jgi:hypothetical protein
VRSSRFCSSLDALPLQRQLPRRKAPQGRKASPENKARQVATKIGTPTAIAIEIETTIEIATTKRMPDHARQASTFTPTETEDRSA